jgi:hypothetical protein
MRLAPFSCSLNHLMSPMRRHVFKRIAVCLSIALFVFLSARLVWTVDRTQTGWETLRAQWLKGTIGVFISGRAEITGSGGNSLSQFWMSEARRVSQAYPEDAELALGAALALECRGAGAMMHLADAFGHRGVAVFEADVNKESIKACREMAARAVAVAPEDVKLRRVQAMLLARTAFHQGKPLAHDDEALAALDACRERDPENALYDYLFAVDCWMSIADVGYWDGAWRYRVKDGARFAQGWASFDAGQAKPYLLLPEDIDALLNRFLKLADITNAERATIVRTGGAATADWPLLFDKLMHMQVARATERLAANDTQGAAKDLRANFRLLDQLALHNADLSRKYKLQATANYHLLNLAAKSPSLLEPGEAALLTEQVRESLLRGRIAEQAWRLRSHREMAYFATTTGSSIWSAAIAVLARLPWAVVFVSLLAVLLLIAARFFPVHEPRPVGWFLNCAWFTAILTVAVVVFALAPGGVISREIQNWGVTIFILAVLPAAALVYGLAWLKRRRFRYGMANLMGLVVAACCLLAVASAVWRYSGVMSRLPFDLAAFALPSESFRTDKSLSLVDAVEQWSAWGAGYITLIAWLLALSVALYNAHKRRNGDQPMRQRFAACCGDWLRTAGRSLAILGALLLAIYLALAPLEIAHNERVFQKNVAIVERPEEVAAEFDADLRAVEADAALMAKARGQAQQVLDRIGRDSE